MRHRPRAYARHASVERKKRGGRASGPIDIREDARQASLGIDEVPELLRLRLLSVRAYDANALMVDADVVDGRPGCFVCRIDRA